MSRQPRLVESAICAIVEHAPVRMISPGKPRSARTSVMPLYAARGVRGFGDGFAIIVLPAYLSAAGCSAGQIGRIAGAPLFGTALIMHVCEDGARYSLARLFIVICSPTRSAVKDTLSPGFIALNIRPS